jgi:hypothetical protein
MRSIKWWMLVTVIFTQSACMLGQTQANLSNGMPPQGSYDGSTVDTVNLVNGNLTLYIPLPFDTCSAVNWGSTITLPRRYGPSHETHSSALGRTLQHEKLMLQS